MRGKKPGRNRLSKKPLIGLLVEWCCKKKRATNLVPQRTSVTGWNALIQSDTYTFFMRRKVSLSDADHFSCVPPSRVPTTFEAERGVSFYSFSVFYSSLPMMNEHQSVTVEAERRYRTKLNQQIQCFFCFVCLDFIFEFIYCYLKTDQQRKDEIKFFWIVSFTLNGSLINAMGKVWIALNRNVKLSDFIGSLVAPAAVRFKTIYEV